MINTFPSYLDFYPLGIRVNSRGGFSVPFYNPIIPEPAVDKITSWEIMWGLGSLIFFNIIEVLSVPDHWINW